MGGSIVPASGVHTDRNLILGQGRTRDPHCRRKPTDPIARGRPCIDQGCPLQSSPADGRPGNPSMLVRFFCAR